MFARFNLWYVAGISRVHDLREREEGQALVEYALILALIALVAIGALTALGTNVRDGLQLIADKIGAAVTGA